VAAGWQLIRSWSIMETVLSVSGLMFVLPLSLVIWRLR